MVFKKGWRRVGKKMLSSCKSHMDVAAMPFRLEEMLESKGLPRNIEEIEDSGDESSPPHTNIPPDVDYTTFCTSDGGFDYALLDHYTAAPPPQAAGDTFTQYPDAGPPLTQTQDSYWNPFPSTGNDGASGSGSGYGYTGAYDQWTQPQPTPVVTQMPEIEEEEDDEADTTPCLAQRRERREPNPPNKYTPSDPTGRGRNV